MSNPIKFSPTGISRRAVFNVGVSAIGTATFIALTAKNAVAGKMAQKSVNYQPTPKGPARCDNCKLWEAPNACKSVDGVISPSGWCSIYRKA